MKLIKLVKNNTKWEIGKTVSIDKKLRRPEFCSDGILHAYRSIEQALVMEIKHLYSNYDVDLKIYEVEGDAVIEDYNKVGCYELTPTKELSLPDWYLDIELRLEIFVHFICYCVFHTAAHTVRANDVVRVATDAINTIQATLNTATCATDAANIAVYTAARSVEAAADYHIDVTELMKKAIRDFV